MRPLTIAVIAGEISGDQLGGWLMQALHTRNPAIRFVGLGGENMATKGLSSLFPISDIALIGIAEVLPHVRTLTRRIRETVEFLEQEKPDIIVTIDVPGFSLRVLKQLHARGNIRPKLVHYVAPTVWAYRPERAKIMAERYDHLLCILPFEPPYFEAEKLPTSYIGHEIAWWWRDKGDGGAFRARYGIATDAPLLAVFPGSRRGEIKRLWPVFSATIQKLSTEIPGLCVVIQAPESLHYILRERINDSGIQATLISNLDHKKDFFAAATAALAKSGTIGLECALAGLPSIVAYLANPLSVWLLRRMIKVPFVNLANILAKKMIIPELLQEDCTTEKLASALTPLLTDAAARTAQQTQLHEVAALLGAGDTTSPSEKAAAIILDL